VALYRAATPSATAAEIKQAILADVDVLPAFTGRSVTGGRLTTGRLTGAAESARYAFTSMTSPAGLVSPAIGVTGPRAAGDYEVVLGLGMEDGGEIWALADKPVTLGGVTVTTDDAGDAVFPLGSLPGLDGTALAPRMELGDGRYVLTVQTYRDGAPVGRTYAAPLLVGSAVPVPGTPGGTTPGGSTPGTTTPGTPTPGGTAPGGTSPGTVPTPGTTRPGTPNPGTTSPGGGTTDPGTTSPGTTNPGTTNPGTTTPGVTTPGTTNPGTTTPGVTNPGSTTPGVTTPGTTPGVTNPGTTTPGTPTPGTTTPGATNPGTTTPGVTNPGTTPGAPVPGTTTYPAVGTFRITSLSPNVVGVEGGTLVTVTGEALPANPRVRIGSTALATVVTATTTRVTFRVPARTAGVYDVTVFAADGRSTALADALTYAAAVGTAPGGTTPGGSTPGATPPGGTSPGGTSPGGTTPGGSTPGGSTPGTGPVERTGPSGERLVRSAKFAGLRSIWSIDCSSSCTGVAI
jgi:serine protease